MARIVAPMSNQVWSCNRTLARTIVVVALLTVAFGAACGGGDDDAPEATDTVEPVSALPTDSITIEQDVWHAGWRVTVGTATLGTDEQGIRTLDIDATFENLSNSPSTFNSLVALGWTGASIN